ncbi:MAG: cytochrome c oxidase subunit II [Verrucomicrobiae bacterium]|nr:cytochrome c oxidase subunit II [Verrucomicrobiae bacterium]
MSFWNHILPPENASAHGKSLDDLTLYIHLLMAVLFVGWLAYFLIAVFRFRSAANPKADHVGARSHFSTYAEVGVAAVEVLLLLGFAVPLWAKAVDQFPVATGNPETDPIEIQIVAQQFAWNAHYPGPDGKWGKQDVKFAVENPFGLDPEDPDGKDDVTCLREPFVLPVDRDIICRISSMDVIHCFKLPRMRVTQDAIPGMTIPVHFKPTKIGDYMIICAQLCGNLHSGMKGEFKVVSAEEYATWYAEKAKAGGAGGFE